jgi:S1-C subfamily serine protease
MSALAGAEMLSVRYSDGTSVRASVADADPVADLALLKPEAGRGGLWTEGLAASEADPVGIPLRVMLPGPGERLGVSEAIVRRRIDVRARGGELLPRRLDVEVRAPAVPGAPVVDGAGGVVGVLTRECAEPPASTMGPPTTHVDPAGGGPSMATSGGTVCRPLLVGVPVRDLRAFIVRAGTVATRSQGLREGAPTAPNVGRTVAATTSSPPWLGIRGEADKGAGGAGVHGVRVVEVAPSSPAEKAGLRSGVDVIVSVDGQPVDAPEKLAETIASRAPGDVIQLLVLSGGELRTIQVVLTRQE